MGGLLRKKNKQQQLKPVLPTPPASNVTTTTTVTPLFARFATTAKEVPDKPRLVSSPMVLARSVPSKGAVAQATMYQPMQQRREGNVRPGSREALPTTPVAGPGRGTGGLATATQRPQGVEGPLASEHRTPSIHGEYAHLWSMIVGADGASSSPPEQARRSTENQNIGSESTGSASRVLGSAASSTASNPNLHLHPNFPSSPPPIAPPHTSTPESTSSDPDVDHPHSDRPSSSSRYTSSTLGEPGTTATSLSRDPWNDVQASVSASFSSSSSHPAAHFVPHPSYENVSPNVSANATDRNNDIQVMVSNSFRSYLPYTLRHTRCLVYLLFERD
ncbi:hypothetical protein C0989_008099 [Termitomyces sp. Mn162]|nr:hypothetical protein C0989_008099 [Termitomyces sp. Mn162]